VHIFTGSPTVAAAGVAALLLCGPANGSVPARAPAAAAIGARSSQEEPGVLIGLEYNIAGMPPGSVLNVQFSIADVDTGEGGVARATAGGIYSVIFDRDAFVLSGTPGTPLTAELTEDLWVSVPLLHGTADIPAGTTVTLTNPITGQKIDLHSGSFTLATGISGVGGGAPPPGPGRHR
jgi:hypothetical protein